MANASEVVVKIGGFSIKKSLDVLRHKEFHTAKDQINMALTLFQEGKDATEEFKKARANAETAVNVVKKVSDKKVSE